MKKVSIDKIRYEVPLGKHTYEVDVFQAKTKGLIVAEIELQSETESLKTELVGRRSHF